jgi:hypothetical protein
MLALHNPVNSLAGVLAHHTHSLTHSHQLKQHLVCELERGVRRRWWWRRRHLHHYFVCRLLHYCNNKAAPRGGIILSKLHYTARW